MLVSLGLTQVFWGLPRIQVFMGPCQARRGVFGPRERKFWMYLVLKVSCGPSYAHLIFLPEQDITSDSIHFPEIGLVEFPLESLSISYISKVQSHIIPI